MRTTLVSLVMLAVVVAGCGPPERPADPAGPSVVLITVDTLRADHLGAYGAGSEASPRLDQLAREGTLFEQAISPMPVTRPAHTSLLTSLHPRDHGVMSNADALVRTDGALVRTDGALVRTEDVPRLVTEEFAAAGYRTAAFTGVKLLAPGSGLEPGFETFEAPVRGEDRLAEEVIQRAIAWLEGVTGEPFFLWVHVYDPHMPYGPPEPYRVPAPAEQPQLEVFSRPELTPLVAPRDGDLPASLLEYALRQYAAEVAYVDSWLGRLFDAVDRLEGETVVAVTSDHGECFGHGIYFEHGGCLYDGALRVPLILHAPGRVPAGRRVPAPVELADVAPTLLELAGLAIPPAFEGISLARIDELTMERAAFAQHPLYSPRALKRRRERRQQLRSVAGEPLREVFEGQMVAVRTPAWKLIASSGHRELYDLVADPEEERDVTAEHPDEVMARQRQLRAWLAEHPLSPKTSSVIDEELEKTLESLGY